MGGISFNLVVLRTMDMERAVAFYTQLGLRFVEQRHGSGQEHFSAEISGGVFELYPWASDGPSTVGARIGFQVPSVDSALAALSEFPGAVLSPARNSEWGRRAVVVDPDGHRVELSQGALTVDAQDYSVILGGIGQTVIYEDAMGPMIFAFSDGSQAGKSICLRHYDSDTPRSSQYNVAFERSRQYLESLGYVVEVSEGE
jgi:predicted enzyme related to lactoylglutathione lyase